MATTMASPGKPAILRSRARRLVTLTVACMLAAATVRAAEPRTEHTFGLTAGEARPAATLADAAWLIGTWAGTGFGQQVEETWGPATAGSMVGTFKLYDDRGVSFYEIMTITVDNGTLSLKVKHFNADFTAWEEKADFVNFKLVKLEPDALHFGGLSFYRRDDDGLDAYIVMRESDETVEYHLDYRRVR